MQIQISYLNENISFGPLNCRLFLIFLIYDEIKFLNKSKKNNFFFKIIYFYVM